MFFGSKEEFSIGTKVCTKTGVPHQNGKYLSTILRFTTLPNENNSLLLTGVYLKGCKNPVNINTLSKLAKNIKNAKTKDIFSKY